MATPAISYAKSCDPTTPTPHWPLAFHMQKRKPEASCLQTSGFSSSSRLLDLQEFLSPVVSSDFNEGKTKVFYSCSKRDSELAARHFLTRLLPIVAFDMQWAEDDCSKEALQKKVGLIQIATEDKVALFHLGIHPGKTSQDIIAPSLKRLIEDPKIAKVGIDIWNGHSSRLNRWFGLNPKGIVECSHLYRLVKFGRSEPKLVTTQPVSFEDQILDQLGLILGTGNSQCSFLGGTLKREEKDRAARKAYVINRLYRAMDKKRSDMRPSPPMPIYAECYPDGKMSSDDPVLLDAGNAHTHPLTLLTTTFPPPPQEQNQTPTNPATPLPQIPRLQPLTPWRPNL
ncbi:conserved hypothetical protein [Pyrenophora tritici-repentis Pt-1C-BFP]|uniref:3'-5' exonuclease domain-containing protein n=1 Tax=Pyrenophora tritici-repentis (strain Pt-1C-BFP) TaxID=426418 RepID=B2WLM5_PYRTR|nr:uncharacterized protein PTRG_10885 [Pyrenophora tritici-repentis Pt-1C-BFP]EDU43935.1 conserved hypothetical protein [Pyrenophora tritici-repentis Pt-1C-BFP]